jgi:hypothetical protein
VFSLLREEEEEEEDEEEEEETPLMTVERTLDANLRLDRLSW